MRLQIGEFVSDYVELLRDYRGYNQHTTPPKDDVSETTLGNGATPPAAGDRHGQPDITPEKQQQQQQQQPSDQARQNGLLEDISEKTPAQSA